MWQPMIPRLLLKFFLKYTQTKDSSFNLIILTQTQHTSTMLCRPPATAHWPASWLEIMEYILQLTLINIYLGNSPPISNSSPTSGSWQYTMSPSDSWNKYTHLQEIYQEFWALNELKGQQHNKSINFGIQILLVVHIFTFSNKADLF